MSDERYFVEELEDETLVFDRRTARCHCLDRLAATVWRLSRDRRCSVEELSRRATEELGEVVDPALVTLADERLRGAGLLGEDEGVPRRQTLSRRQLVRRAAAVAGALSLPSVSSVVAPLPASAQTSNCDGQTSIANCPAYQCPQGQTCVAEGSACFCVSS